MELKEFAEIYFGKKDFKMGKLQQEFIDNISDGKKIILRNNRFFGRKTVNQILTEYLNKIKYMEYIIKPDYNLKLFDKYNGEIIISIEDNFKKMKIRTLTEY